VIHNENSRVKIPAIIHLVRMGYEFIDQKEHDINRSNNIFKDILKQSLKKINPQISDDKIEQKIKALESSLNNDDLGNEFLKIITKQSEVTVIDFDDINNNVFHVVTELKYSKIDGEEFFPDITVLVNGLPLCFIEVKKPNNKDGMLAEKNRMDSRFRSKNNKEFWNITQLMIFSNNMEYSPDDQNKKIVGSYYSTPNYEKTVFNYFREEKEEVYDKYEDAPNEEIDKILSATNLQSIKDTSEFDTNLNALSPINKFLSSLLNKERFLFFIKYGLAIVEYIEEEISIIEKQIIRYPQFFATLAIEENLEKQSKKGIIWHTQGSGKTALAYHNVRYLNDYYAKQEIISKFYFIVDRLDLLEQAKEEFEMRGLYVNTVNSKKEFINEFSSKEARSSSSGDNEITVVNVQKFADDFTMINQLEYNVEFQRVYFIDEAHRSYKKEGNFFTNLVTADRNAVMISLTGTPRIKNYLSKELFGDYIHTYYYNKSIQDGFTLRLMRENIESSFKLELEELLEDLKVKEGTGKKSKIMQHTNVVKPLTNYIINDLDESKKLHDDDSIGGMIVAYDSDQARAIFNELEENYNSIDYALILHDEGDKESRKTKVKQYKKGEIDIFIVDRMLLTGFDAPRLKKLYLCRTILNLSLLQTLTRVNRPYNEFKFGYIVDFADISKEFEKTNQDYLKELQEASPESFEHIDTFFMSEEEIKQTTIEASEILFFYDTENLEEFSKQLDEISEKEELLAIKTSLERIKNVFNIAKQADYADVLKDIDIDTIRKLFNITSSRIDTVNKELSLRNDESTESLINYLLSSASFDYFKKGEEELKIVDEIIMNQTKVADELSKNIDNKDPRFISLIEEFRRIVKNTNMNEISEENVIQLKENYKTIYDEMRKINSEDQRIRTKYNGDAKYLRIHKRINEELLSEINPKDLVGILNNIKEGLDDNLSNNSKVILNDKFFLQEIRTFTAKGFYRYSQEQEIIEKISLLISREYENEFKKSAA